MRSEAIIQKADMTIGDLSTNGGELVDMQANQFIQKVTEAPTILNLARRVVMTSPQMQINKIGFGSRILKPAVSATALSVGDRSAPTTEQVLLSTKEVIAQVNLSYDVVENQIEQPHALGVNPSRNSGDPVTGSFTDTIVNLIAMHVAKDLEELLILGDTGSGDAYLALLDGLLVQSTSNVLDAAGSAVNRSIFKNALQTMPDKYKRNTPFLRNFVSMNNEIEYRDTVADRETPTGDAQINGETRQRPFGVPVEPVALMPGTNAILTFPQNVIWGVQRRISIEYDKDIQARVFIIVVTLRLDAKYEEEEAVVKTINITAA